MGERRLSPFNKPKVTSFFVVKLFFSAEAGILCLEMAPNSNPDHCVCGDIGGAIMEDNTGLFSRVFTRGKMTCIFLAWKYDSVQPWAAAGNVQKISLLHFGGNIEKVEESALFAQRQLL